MSRTDARIRDVLAQLGISPRGDPTDLVVERCLHRITRWCAEIGAPETLEELLELVAAKLRLRFEVIETDDDIERVRDAYLSQGELAFVSIETELRGGTDALVLRLEHVKPWADAIYVAVVDGRGQKRSRVWFSKWHEIAHLVAEPQTSFVFRRTPAFKREPVERLMDQIAGALAFYEPLFLPALRARGVNLDRPLLSELRDFHAANCSFASLQATMQAALQHVAVPAILIEAKLAPKVSEARASRESGRAAKLQLRAATTAHNPAALRTRFFIHRNMRVPTRSIIARVFHGGVLAPEFTVAHEDLSAWESQGEHLAATPVVVEAMRAGPERVLALCTKQ